MHLENLFALGCEYLNMMITTIYHILQTMCFFETPHMRINAGWVKLNMSDIVDEIRIKYNTNYNNILNPVIPSFEFLLKYLNSIYPGLPQ